MPAKAKITVILLLILDAIFVFWILLQGKTIAILEPHGIIAHQEKGLMLTVALSGLAIIIPTVLLFYFFAFHYRETGKPHGDNPDLSGNPKVQFVIWLIPSLVVLWMIVLIWQSTHALDPFRPIASDVKPMTIQVVALRWKWLFIYPKEHIATVNQIVFPEKTPVTFELTADAPMNSFWIPQLGGQMYAMEGMVNKTHLMADESGEFQGSDAEISGKGFAGMRFKAKATTHAEFAKWVATVKETGQPFSWDEYSDLAKPSIDNEPTAYVLSDKELYNEIVAQFLPPTIKTQTLGAHDMNMQGMEMNQ